MKKILVFGDNLNAKWHPLDPVFKELCRILPDCSLEATEDYARFADVANYDAVISYLEYTDTKISPAQAAALLSYLAKGGAFLVLHNGISLQSCPEIAQAIGGRFTRHDPYDAMPQLNVRMIDGESPITQGVEDFIVPDEPYEYEMDSFVPPHVVAEYSYKDKVFPAAWTKRYGLGKIVYFEFGHSAQALQNEQAAKMLQNGVKWFFFEEE